MIRLLKNTVIANFFVLLVYSPVSALAQDCNANGIPDSTDLASTGFIAVPVAFYFSAPTLQTAALLDVDLDGKKDIIQVSSASGAITASVIKQDGLAFAGAPSATFALPFVPTAIGIGDFDSNGFADIGFATDSAQVNAFNQGNDRYVVVGGQLRTAIPPISFGGGAAAQQDADLNGDGRLDRVVVNSTQVDVYLRDPMNALVLNASFPVSFPYLCAQPTMSKTVEILPPVDIDADSDLDVVILANQVCSGANGIQRAAQLTFLDNDGAANFGSHQLQDYNDTYTFLEYNDVNEDGTKDLIFKAFQGTGMPVSPPLVTNEGIFIYRINRNTVSKDRNGNNIPDECERAVPGDFGGDRKSDYAVVRPIQGNLLWLIRHSGELALPEATQEFFGLSPFDLPFAGDFDGNGTFEPAVVRDAGAVIPSLYGLYWYNRLPDGSANSVQWGLPGDTPITGYFDADKITDRGVTRIINGQLTWFIRPSDNSTIPPIPWGLPGDATFAADFNNDSVDELVVARNFLGGVYWFIRNLDGTFQDQILWGLAGLDTPLAPMDVDQDGKADLAIARRNGRFLNYFIRLSTGGVRTLSFGLSSDIPYLGYFGDEGIAEPAVFRPAANAPGAEAYHFQLTASGLIRVRNWGFFGDLLVRPDGKGIRP